MSFAEQKFAVDSKLLQTLPSEISNENISEEIPPALKVYKRRWYILLIFSLVSMEQSLFWITVCKSNRNEFYRSILRTN